MDETTTGPQEPASAPAAGRPLRRRTDSKLIAGVASGIADHLGVDPTFVRLGFVLLALFAGLGIVLYAAAWWLIPPDTRQDSRVERLLRRLRGAPASTAALLILAGLALLAPYTGIGAPVLWGIALIVVGATVYRQGWTLDPAPETAELAPPDVSVEPAPGEEASRKPARSFALVRRRRERSGLGWATLGAAFLATGLVAFLDDAGAVHLGLSQFIAVPLAIVAAGLVVGAWRGRARATILVGLLLLPPLLLTSLVDVPLSGGFGAVYHRPTAREDLPEAYRLVAGSLTIDLTTYPFGEEPVEIDAGLGAGEIRVFVPEEVAFEGDAQVEAGQLHLVDVFEEGLGLDERITAGPGTPQLTLHLDAAIGGITVYREEA